MKFILMLMLSLSASLLGAVNKDEERGAIATWKSIVETKDAPRRPHEELVKSAHESLQVIVDYALNSPDVKINFGPKVIPWVTYEKSDPEQGRRVLLLGAYLVGTIEHQWRAGKADGDHYEGWLRAIALYRQFVKLGGPKIAEMEVLAALDDAELKELARDVADVRRPQTHHLPQPNP